MVYGYEDDDRLMAEAAILGPQGGCDPVPGRGLPAPPGAAALLTQSGV